MERITAAEALAALKHHFAEDQDYAESWHDNLAACAKDEQVEHEVAQRIAARFMKLAFDVETGKR